MSFRKSLLKREYQQTEKVYLKDSLEKPVRIMKTEYLKYFLFMTFIMLITWILSCSGRSLKTSEKKSEAIVKVPDEPSLKLIKMTSPEENAGFKLNEQIKIILTAEDKNTPDSVKIWFDSQLVTVLKVLPWEYTVPSSFVTKTGRKSLKVVAYKSGSNSQTITRFLLVYSDGTPKRNSYKVINTYPHDKGAFTQGLVYENGLFYEGTGEVGTSYLRKVEPETGKVLFQLNLEPPLFGEGIAILGDRIFQLTWESKVGFVYNKNTMKQINKIYYQTEGWGLTTVGNKLVMSDGTNCLYFMDPDQFNIVSSLEVYDNEKKVEKLNELEYINGEIWANIWQTDLIARIDASSGKVIAYIDMRGILSDPETDTNINVLNGIAYDQAGKRIFVTGKNWPKLFEIRITE
jgi:glutaminyl-peptide cyclotransferase